MACRVSICSFFFVFALSLIASQIYAEESSKESVLTLDHSNFHDTISKHDFIVVEFYAPWYVLILLFFCLFSSSAWCLLLLICYIGFDFVLHLAFVNFQLWFCVYTHVHILLWFNFFCFGFNSVFWFELTAFDLHVESIVLNRIHWDRFLLN